MNTQGLFICQVARHDKTSLSIEDCLISVFFIFTIFFLLLYLFFSQTVRRNNFHWKACVPFYTKFLFCLTISFEVAMSSHMV